MPSIEEKGATFAPLGIDEYERLEEAVRKQKIEFLKGKLDEFKLEGDKRFVAWRDGRPDKVTWEDVLFYLGTAAGVKAALTMSLEKGGASSDKVKTALDQYDVFDGANLARTLVGFEKRIHIGEAKPDPNAPAAPGSSGS